MMQRTWEFVIESAPRQSLSHAGDMGNSLVPTNVPLHDEALGEWTEVFVGNFEDKVYDGLDGRRKLCLVTSWLYSLT